VRYRKLFQLTRFLWRLGLGYIFHIAECAWMLIAFFLFSRSEKKNTEGKVIGLVFSPRTVSAVNQVLRSEVDLWISFPWVRNEASTAQAHLFSFLKTKDFLLALIMSLKSHKIICADRNSSEWCLHSYTAFKWFLVRIGLEKIGAKQYIISQHFDRWAALVGYLSKEKNIPLSIVQHGIIYDKSSETDKGFPFYIPNRIARVDNLYIYDEKSEEIFLNEIINEECIVKAHIYSPQILIQKIMDSAAPSILFVGHTLCEEFQIKLYLELKKQISGLVAFYKPHPSLRPSADIHKVSWVVISEKDYFPEVRMLLSYPSTLADEYARHNIPSVIHPLKVADDEMPKVVSKVVHLLNSREI